jgi:Rieske Fe-S protein
MADTGKPDEGRSEDRRDFLGSASRAAMAAGLIGGYGGFAAIALRFLYPSGGDDSFWQLVAKIDEIGVGESILYRGPSGETINIARQHRNGNADDFVALSSTCPHLGCQVRWEAQNNRFFCPCHNGVFDPSGVATGGPPAEAGQSLSRYPLKVEGGLLHIAVPPQRFAIGERKGEIIEVAGDICGPGHDPCLAARPHTGGTERKG